MAATKLASEEEEKGKVRYRQLDLFSSLDDETNKLDYDREVLRNENNLQNAMLKIKKKYGKKCYFERYGFRRWGNNKG